MSDVLAGRLPLVVLLMGGSCFRTRAAYVAVIERAVVLLAFDGVTLMDIAGPADVFDVASRYALSGDIKHYDVSTLSVRGGAVRSSSGLKIHTTPLAGIDPSTIDTLIVPGGGPPENPPVPEDLVDWLALHGPKARRVCSVCTGSSLVASAGLAQGRRLTTHWRAVDNLRSSFPNVTVESKQIFVRDGDLWSSAGFTAGIDLALALIEEDHGRSVALIMARLLIMFIKRPGTQPQLSASLASQTAGDPTFEHLHAWMANSLGYDLRVEVLAKQVNMAPRTFARRYSETVGRTPAKTVQMMRIEAACCAMVEPDLPLKLIALNTGFGDEQNLRRAFLKYFGVVPQCVRDRFSKLN